MEISHRLPPQSIELEKVVLGAILIEKDAINEILDVLDEKMFYKEANGKVYRAIKRLFERKDPIDYLTITQELKKMGELENVGGAYYVASLTENIAASVHIEKHARIIQEKYLLRKMSEISQVINNLTYSQAIDCFDVIEKNRKEIDDLLAGIITNKIESVGEIKDLVIEDCFKAISENRPSGILCGIRSLNDHTGGWQKSTLTIIAARPGMGKTAFALDCAFYPAMNEKPVAFFSLEMSKIQLVGRLLSSITQMPVQQINNRQLSPSDVDILNKEGACLNGVPLYIDDNPELNIDQLKQKARRLKREKKIEMIIIDYLQLMKGSERRGNREQEVSEISRGLKILSRELDIPIIALSQLNRGVESREDKKPLLSDLRESGAIEQDADNVIFLYRPEHYGLQSYSLNGVEYSSFELFIFILAKFRNGGLGEIKARWKGSITKVENF